MRERIADLEADVARLNADLLNANAKSDLRMDKRELETILKMKEQVEEAYEKGFQRCKQQFKELQELQRNMQK